MKIKTYSTLLGALLLSALVQDATASTWQMCGGTKVKWPSESVNLRASSVGFPVGSSWANALQSVVTRWTNTASDMDYSLTLNEPGVALGNGQNEVWWTDSLGAPAICYTWWNGSCQLVEADVVFLNTVSYTTSTTKGNLSPYGGPSRPFQTTAMHELGHAQGLGHTSDTYSIMGQDWDHIHANGDTATAYPGEDAVAGSVDVYGYTSGSHEDLGVAHWKHSGASGAYSTHTRTGLFRTNGASYLTEAGMDEPTFKVAHGDVVRLEMSFENMGKTTQTVNVGYYVSTNNYISTSDTFLGSQAMTLGLNTVYTIQSTNLSIPGWLTGGQVYYLGAIIDYDSAVSEAYTSNNATYTAIKVNLSPPDVTAVSISGPNKIRSKKSATLTIDTSKLNYSGAYTYEIRISKNTIISDSDILLHTGTTSASGLQSITFMMPKIKKKDRGKYYLGLIILPVAGETETSNNSVASATKIKVKK